MDRPKNHGVTTYLFILNAHERSSLSVKSQDSWDPVFVNSKREAKFILLTFTIFAVYCLLYCWWDGFHNFSATASSMASSPEGRDEFDLKIVFGMPRWVFWGVFIPWIAAFVVTVFFCRVILRDDLEKESP